jgi:hypothetical protein
MAYIVDVFQKAYVGLYKLELAAGVELIALFDNAVGRLLRPADNVGSWFDSILGEHLYCVFANATGPANKDGYETMRQGSGDALVRRDGLRE